MKLRSLFIIGASSLFLASCLKSRDSLGLINDKGSIVTEIADINTDGDPKVVSLKSDPPTETFTLITVKYHAGGKAQPNGTMHVKLVKDDAAVTAAGLTILPTNAYTLGALEFDIPKDTRQVAIPITINKANLDLSQSYGLAFKIAEVNNGVISELAKSILVNILIRNKYDGIYKVTGSMTDLTNASLTGYYPEEAQLITAGALENDMYSTLINGGTYGHPILNGAATSYYGNFTPHFVFDANDNVIAVVNGYGQGAGSRWGVLDPTGVNKYDAATKTLKVKYTMNQPNAATVRTQFDETWTFLRDR